MTDEQSPSLSLARLEPAVTGSLGTQAAAVRPKTGPIAVGPVPADSRHLGAALTTYLDSRSVAVATIAVSAFEDQRERAAQLAHELELSRHENERLNTLYRDERERRVVLEDRAARSGFAQFVEIVGSLLAGTGLPMIFQGPEYLGWALTIAGALVTGATVVQARQGREE